VVDGAASAGGGSVTGNIQRAEDLIDQVLTGAVAGTQDLRDRLIANIQAISDLADAGSGGALVALKQLIGEESLPYVEIHHETLQKRGGVVAKRRNFLMASAALPPAAGYKDAMTRLWVSGFGSWVKQNDEEGLFGYRYDSKGLVLGFDHELAAVPGLTLGVNVAVSGGTLKNNDNLAETDVDAQSLGLSALYRIGGGLFLYGDLEVGRATYDSEIYLRAINAVKRSDFDSRSIGAGLGAGYVFGLTPDVSLTASAGLEYVHISQDGWRETIVSDPDNLAVANWFGDMSRNYLDVNLSLKLESVHRIGQAEIRPEVHGGVIFSANSKSDDLRMGFAGSNSSMNLDGLETGRARFQGGVGLKAQLTDTFDIGLTYELEARKGYRAHYGQIGVGVSF
jgi:outer membrane autotransporter protein